MKILKEKLIFNSAKGRLVPIQNKFDIFIIFDIFGF